MNSNIDNAIDFYKEIQQTDNLTNHNSCYNQDNICLISFEPLDSSHITLSCNHKFNYQHIFNDAVKQKYHINKYKTSILKTNELRCPYCRNIQNKIIPYRNIENCDKKIYGINYPKKFCMSKNIQCSYIFKKGKNKGMQCSKFSDYTFCNLHNKQNNKQNNILTNS
tara:strand:+ start:12 stop:509 length:498 start_codon:yes stop_codon:yes gene_type:complete